MSGRSAEEGAASEAAGVASAEGVNAASYDVEDSDAAGKREVCIHWSGRDPGMLARSALSRLATNYSGVSGRPFHG